LFRPLCHSKIPFTGPIKEPGKDSTPVKILATIDALFSPVTKNETRLALLITGKVNVFRF